MHYDNQKILKVGSGTSAKRLAGSVLSCLEDGYTPRMQAIGPHSVNQMIKGFIIAKGIAASKNITLHDDLFFETLDTEEGEASAVCAIVFTLDDI